MLYSNIVLMLNLCVKNFVSAHGRHFFLFKQSFCYQVNLVIEKCRIQKPKNYYNFHFFVKVLLTEKKMHLRMTMKMKILVQCQHHPHLLLTSYHLLHQLNDLLNHLLSLSSQIKCHQGAKKHKERHP